MIGVDGSHTWLLRSLVRLLCVRRIVADSENLLLEAAGQTSASPRNRRSFTTSRRRREGSYLDHGSDSREDYSDDGCSYLGRKPSGSQVPLQKRFESTEIHGDQGSPEGDEDYGGSDPGVVSSDESDYVGSNLNEDDDDRWKPVRMTELLKEWMLCDQATKRDDKDFKKTFMKMKENEEASQAPSAGRIRSLACSADRAAAKDGALNKLRAKRLKQRGISSLTINGSSDNRDFSPSGENTLLPVSIPSFRVIAKLS